MPDKVTTLSKTWRATSCGPAAASRYHVIQEPAPPRGRNTVVQTDGQPPDEIYKAAEACRVQVNNYWQDTREGINVPEEFMEILNGFAVSHLSKNMKRVSGPPETAERVEEASKEMFWDSLLHVAAQVVAESWVLFSVRLQDTETIGVYHLLVEYQGDRLKAGLYGSEFYPLHIHEVDDGTSWGSGMVWGKGKEA